MKPDIIIPKIQDHSCQLWRADRLIGEISNNYELNAVRIQIKKEKSEDYSIKWGGHQILIDKDGRLDKWPEGFYDLFVNQLSGNLPVHKSQ